jgi:hypothetical protein
MTPTVTMREALKDVRLLGNLLAGESWLAWRVLLIAMMGEPLSEAERELFRKLTDRETEPLQLIEEFVAVVGRRGGKSRAMALLAAYIAGLCRHTLVKGETGVLLCIAPDQRQASIVLEYAVSAFEQSPILKQLIANRTADTLELTNGVSIEVRSASFRRLRGPTYIGVIADEAAFWYSDEFSSNTDSEILNAVRPGLVTTGGPLVIASSPYAKRGVLWETHRKHFGKNGDPRILVAQGASRDFNPSLPQSVIDRAMERDRAHASAEFLAQFRNDIDSFVPLEVVSACVGTYVEAAYTSKFRYHAFNDPSGGSSDAFTLAISHREGDRTIIDAIREVRPPFSPEAVVDEFSALLKSYGIKKVQGDKYGGEFPRELYRKRGIEYRCCDKTKSDLYRDLLPLLNSGRIALPKSDRLVQQLCGLERRVSRAGKDSIDHGPGAHDDLSNAVAGAADLAGEHRVNPPAQFTTYSYRVDRHRLDGPITEGLYEGGYATSR